MTTPLLNLIALALIAVTTITVAAVEWRRKDSAR